MIRDEVDIVESTVRHMAAEVDFLIVADNRSVDGTREILDSLAGELPLTVVDDPQMGYYQSQTMTTLAARAAERGAEWIVPFDADEWHYSPFGRLADVLAECPQAIALAPSYTYVATAEDDPEESDAVKRMGWRERDRYPLPKVACRASPGLTINQGNHSADYGKGVARTVNKFAIRHFPYRSYEQFERKVKNGAAAMSTTALENGICIHWREYGAILAEGGRAALERVYYERHFRDDPRAEVVVDGKAQPPLVFDPTPVGT